MKIGICDDDEKEHLYLMQTCNLYGEHTYMHFYSGEELMNATELPELLFLDIEMPSLNGLDAMRHLENSSVSPYILFYTCHTELMADAFGKKVLGFLRKPISVREIQKYLLRTEGLLTIQENVILENNDKIMLGNILYIESDGNYSIFHTSTQEIYFSHITMREWAAKLSYASFSRIHRKYIVNYYHVKEIKEQYVVLANGQQLPISRRRISETRQSFKNFLFNKKAI